MVPSMMERLLFDDILYGRRARREHGAFEAVLRSAGVETLDPAEMLTEVLTSDTGARESLLTSLRARGLRDDLLRELETMAPADLARVMVVGIVTDDGSLEHREGRFYRLPPLPNLFFQRDPQAVFGSRVLLASMATDARDREPLLARTVFENHSALAGWDELVGLDEVILDEVISGSASGALSIEGGDILIAAPDVLLVGLSERTNRLGIEAFARYFGRAHAAGIETGFRHLIVVEVPPRRSYMHLDTVFTFIDRGLCLAYLPVIAAGGLEAGAVYRIDLNSRRLSYTVCDHLPAALAEVGVDVELVPCGGSGSLIDQQREQWTDGANAFAIAPGVIALYRRNRRTVDELARRGFRVLKEEDVLDKGIELLGHGPTVVTFRANELSRARGGPRCMTMPLERDDLTA